MMCDCANNNCEITVMFSKAATLKVFPKRKRSQITMIEIDGTIEDKGTIWLYCDLMHTYVCISTYVYHFNILAKNELQIYKIWKCSHERRQSTLKSNLRLMHFSQLAILSTCLSIELLINHWCTQIN